MLFTHRLPLLWSLCIPTRAGKRLILSPYSPLRANPQTPILMSGAYFFWFFSHAFHSHALYSCSPDQLWSFQLPLL